MSLDQPSLSLEGVERLGQFGVALIGRHEERVVRRELARGLPDTLHGHELWRVRREPVKLDEVTVRVEPRLAVVVEPVARRVVDDQEHLPAFVAENELPQEFEEGGTVEDVRESERELGVVERDGAIDVRRLAEPVRVDARLNSDA